MKKSLFFAAAVSALMLTACSSENDVVQSASELQQSAPKAVGFDVYTQNANEVTRGGYKGVMNTSRLQGIASGFGIFGYYTDQTGATARNYPYTTDGASDGANNYIPNFMWNEHVTWNNTNKGWVYSPLKYWPNETENDSQTEKAIMDGTTSLLDQLTFFAYAPYVDPSATGFDATEGIRAITANTGVLTAQNGGAQAKGDPAIEYKTSAKVEDAVDLLWGVAPAGGLNYTAVNGDNDGALEGMPYIDLVKPDVNTSLKFYFQHALARFGFTVAAAIDQVPQGGDWPGDNKTRITVKQVDLTGYFANEGILNLKNTEANVANWINFNGTALEAATALDGGALTKRTISITADIADDIEDSGSGSQITAGKTGVTTAKQDLLVGRYSQIDVPAYVPSKKYYSDATGTVATATYTVTGSEGYYTYDNVNDIYTKKASGSINAPAVGSTVTGLFTLATAGTANDQACPNASATYYTYDDAAGTYTVAGLGSSLTWNSDGSTTYYTVVPTAVPSTSIDFTYSAPIYDAERSYLMLIPTNNVKNICTTNFGDPIAKAENLEALRTVWVTITYYVTTDDDKLADEVSRVENKIQKKVVLPSLANGKSYNLNLLLGLTSVKVEAEVGDWSEEFIQADLPQNTPGQ